MEIWNKPPKQPIKIGVNVDALRQKWGTRAPAAPPASATPEHFYKEMKRVQKQEKDHRREVEQKTHQHRVSFRSLAFQGPRRVRSMMKRDREAQQKSRDAQARVRVSLRGMRTNFRRSRGNAAAINVAGMASDNPLFHRGGEGATRVVSGGIQLDPPSPALRGDSLPSVSENASEQVIQNVAAEVGTLRSETSQQQGDPRIPAKSDTETQQQHGSSNNNGSRRHHGRHHNRRGRSAQRHHRQNRPQQRRAKSAMPHSQAEHPKGEARHGDKGHRRRHRPHGNRKHRNEGGHAHRRRGHPQSRSRNRNHHSRAQSPQNKSGVSTPSATGAAAASTVASPAHSSSFSPIQEYQFVHPSGSSLRVSNFGATIMSFKSANGVEHLFLSKLAKRDGSKPIRGGIPVVFPQFGGGTLPNHGFARTSVWELTRLAMPENESSPLTISFRLKSTAATMEMWPHEFSLMLTINLTSDRLETQLSVENVGTTAFDFQALQHTYLLLDGDIKDVSVVIPGLEECKYTDKVRDAKVFENDSDVLRIGGETDSVHHSTPDEISVDLLKSDSFAPKVVGLITKSFTKTSADGNVTSLPSDCVVWNPWSAKAEGMSDFGNDEYRQMLCVEPGCVSRWETCGPGEVCTLTQRLETRSALSQETGTFRFTHSISPEAISELNEPEVLVHSSTEELGDAVAARIAELIKESADQPTFNVALSGGSLPKMLAEGLLKRNKDEFQFDKWRVFFADERLVPSDHEDSNLGACQGAFLDVVGIPAEHVFGINSSVSVEECAKQYQSTLLDEFGVDGIPQFDLILLGMGPDGHTCSLFPNHELLKEQSLFVAPIRDSPKPPAERITLTYPVLNNARNVFYMSAGDSKADAIANVTVPNQVVEDNVDSVLPAGRVRPTRGKLVWFIDDKAGAKL